MNAITEKLTVAAQAANLLASDLLQVHTEACNVGRPEGMSMGDKAIAAVVSDLLCKAREIESALLRIL